MNKGARLYAELMEAIRQIKGQIPCAGQSDLFDDDLGGLDQYSKRKHIQAAKVLCKTCPVMNLCAEYAIVAEEPTGVWGSLSTTDRERKRSLR